MSTDARWIVGLLLPTMIGMFLIVGTMINGRLDSMQADMREMRTMLFTLIQSQNAGPAQIYPEVEGSLK